MRARMCLSIHLSHSSFLAYYDTPQGILIDLIFLGSTDSSGIQKIMQQQHMVSLHHRTPLETSSQTLITRAHDPGPDKMILPSDGLRYRV